MVKVLCGDFGAFFSKQSVTLFMVTQVKDKSTVNQRSSLPDLTFC
jgi:hypothetical protein